MLFTELALIRWLGANVVYLSYYSNFVLLGSFLGFGLGFLWAGRSSRSIFPFTPLILGALVAYVDIFPVPLKVTTTEVIFFNTVEPKSPIPREVVLLILFTAVAGVMACIGDGVARTFGRFEPLEAYRLDLIGSVCGIAGFTALSFVGARPLIWGLIAAAVLLLTLPLRPRLGMQGLRRWGTLVLAVVGLLMLVGPLVPRPATATSSGRPITRSPTRSTTRAASAPTSTRAPTGTRSPPRATPSTSGSTSASRCPTAATC
jgi:hypothetical protein